MKKKRGPAEKLVVEKTLALAKFLLAFGRIERVTKHEDGERWETDSDHTVMLGVMACAFAKEYTPHLDTGKIAEFALVHDLVEVYAGDFNSFGIPGDAGKEEKAQREHEALVRIKEEYGEVFPWLGETIEEYERLDTKEACFVKFFDKLLPKITHILNEGAIMRTFGKDEEGTRAFHAEQHTFIVESYGKDHPQVTELFDAICDRVIQTCFGAKQ